MYSFNNKEITIDKYNTPTPWMNYLSNGTFHTMISQAGGGVAFYKSPQIWRINHYRFSICQPTGAAFIHTLKTVKPSGVRQMNRAPISLIAGKPLTAWVIPDLLPRRTA